MQLKGRDHNSGKIRKVWQAKDVLEDLDCGISRACRSLCKNNLRLLTRVLTEHCTLKGHLHKLGIAVDASWRFCGDEEGTPRHLLMNCDVITITRARSFVRHQISLEDVPRLDPLQILDLMKRLGLED